GGRRRGRLAALKVLACDFEAVNEPYGLAKLAFDGAALLVARDAFTVARYDPVAQELGGVLRLQGAEAGPGSGRLALGTDPLSHVVLTTESHRTTHGAFVPIKSRGKLLGVLPSEARAETAFD